MKKHLVGHIGPVFLPLYLKNEVVIHYQSQDTATFLLPHTYMASPLAIYGNRSQQGNLAKMLFIVS